MKSERGSAFIVVLIIVVLILIVSAIGFFMYRKKTEETATPATSDVKKEVTIKEQEPTFSKSDYVIVKEEDYLKFKDVFEELKIEKVSFSNLDKGLTQDFLDKQEEIIGNFETQYNYIKQKLSNGLANGCKAKTTVFCEIVDDILTVQYTLDMDIDFKYGMDEVETVTLNIDLANMKKLSTKDMFELYEVKINELATQLFNDIVYFEDPEFLVVDAVTKENITYAQVGENKTPYITRVEKALNDIVQVRVEGEDVYLIFKDVDLVNACFDIAQSGPFEYTTLKLEANN